MEYASMHNLMYLWCIHTVQYMVPIFAPQETIGDPSWAGTGNSVCDWRVNIRETAWAS